MGYLGFLFLTNEVTTHPPAGSLVISVSLRELSCLDLKIYPFSQPAGGLAE